MSFLQMMIKKIYKVINQLVSIIIIEEEVIQESENQESLIEEYFNFIAIIIIQIIKRILQIIREEEE